MAASVIDGTLTVNGTVYCSGVSSSGATITNAMVNAAADIDAAKLEHQYSHAVDLNGSSTANAATVRRVIHVVKGTTGTLLDFSVGAVTAATSDATATITLKKNGSAVLTASTSLTSATAAFGLVAAAGFTSTSLVAGDVLECQVTAASAGGGALAQGVFCRLVLREDAA